MITKKIKKSATCIAVIADKRGKLYVAADRRVSWGDGSVQELPKNKNKVNKKDGLIMAGTGDCSMISLIIDQMEIPELVDDIDRYIYTVLYNHVVKQLISKRYCDEHKILRIPSGTYAEIVIAVSNRLFNFVIHNPEADSREHLHGEVLIEELNIPYATGCGGSYAWGSLLTTEDMGLKPRERLTIALNVASRVSSGCDNNIDIESED